MMELFAAAEVLVV